MHGNHPTSLAQELGATYDADRGRGAEQRNALHRALLESGVARPSRWSALRHAAVRAVRRPRQALTDAPCRLPDGRIGRVAVVHRDGEWTLVCMVG